MLLEFILFAIAVFCVLYLPGQFIVRILGIKSANKVSSATLSLTTGVTMFMFSTYLLSWLHLTFLYLVLILPFIVVEVTYFNKNRPKKISVSRFFSLETLILLTGVITLVTVTATSGVEKNAGLAFLGINGIDGLFHTALIGNLRFQFPPTYPGLSHVVLRGYHFLYDLMLSQFGVFFGFSTYDLYFRFFSIFTAFFYGLSGLTLSYSLKMDSITRKVFLFLLYFAQGGEYFLFHWFGNGDALYNSGIVAPAVHIVDPSVLFSMAVVFVLFSVLFTPLKRYQQIIPILLLGVLPGIKIYTAILTYVAVGIIAIIDFLKQKKKDTFFILLFAGFISASIYLPFNLGAGTLIFAPFLIFRHFMESDRFFTSFEWPLKMQVYELHHNVPRIVYLYVLAILAFFIPPLGIRLVLLVKIKNLFHKAFYTPQHIFWITFSLIGFFIPILFIQSVGIFNTVQFYWLLWIVLLIPTAFSLRTLVTKPSVVKVCILSGVLIIASIPSLFIPIEINYPGRVQVFSQNLISITSDIRQNVAAKDDIMVANRVYTVNGYENVYAVPLFGALTGRPMFYEPEAADFSHIQALELGRQAVIDRVLIELATCSSNTNNEVKEIMKTVQTSYLLLLRPDKCVQTLPSFKKVAERGNYSLYKIW